MRIGEEDSGHTHVVDGLVVKVLGGNDLLDNLLLDLLPQLLSGNVLAVLGGHNNGVNAEGLDGTTIMGVLDSDLGLGVGPQPGDLAALASIGHGLVELVGEDDGQRKQLGGLVGGVSEHDTLVTSAELLKGLLVVQTLGNVGRLLLNGNQNVAGLVVKALVGAVVANLLDGATNNLLVVEPGLCGDLTKDHDHASLGGSLTSDLGQRVFSQACVEDSIADLVGNLRNCQSRVAIPGSCDTYLIRVTLSNRLGGKEEGVPRNDTVCVDHGE